MKELLRFSTDRAAHEPVVFDPTFNFGAFYVTPITFSHQILNSRQYDRPAHFIAAVFIHHRRSEDDYKTLFSILRQKYPSSTVFSLLGRMASKDSLMLSPPLHHSLFTCAAGATSQTMLNR
jgi:hypothetical protein